MTVVDARFRVHHPCPYCDISVEFPRTLVLLWCDNQRDVLFLSAPDRSELAKVTRAFRSSVRARTILEDGTDALLSVPEFHWKEPPSVTGLARKGNVWVLHPVVYFDGKETYRVVAASKQALHRLIDRVRRLGDLELLSVSNKAELRTIRDLPTASVHFFEGLTDRQARCLVAAIEGGLLDVPARGSWGDAARTVHLSRSTFGEHLRKGQLRIMANSYASIKARTLTDQTPVLFPSRPPIPRRPRRGRPAAR